MQNLGGKQSVLWGIRKQRMDSLPNFLTHGAPLARASRSPELRQKTPQIRAQMQPISPCGRYDFYQDESLGMKGTSKTKWPSGSVSSVGLAIHRFVWHGEPWHGGVRMMQQESYNFGIMRWGTNTAFMPAIQREMTWRYVKLLMLLLFTSKNALTKSKRY